MRNNLMVGSVLVAFVLGGCASMTETQKGTAKGAAVGAGVGAVVGAIADKGKGAAIGAAVGAGVGAVAGNVWTKRQEEQKRQMEEATAGTGVAVSQTSDNRLKLDIPSDVSFAVGRADIQSNFRPILNTFVTSLATTPNSTVTIIGHTDSSGSDAVNNPLSLNRAASVRDYLVARGVSSSRVAIDGRGSREPLVANDTAANKAKNRRVEIFVAEQAPVAAQ
ncbi:MAG: OmpA family protein [Pseudomonadota bacterium]